MICFEISSLGPALAAGSLHVIALWRLQDVHAGCIRNFIQNFVWVPSTCRSCASRFNKPLLGSYFSMTDVRRIVAQLAVRWSFPNADMYLSICVDWFWIGVVRLLISSIGSSMLIVLQPTYVHDLRLLFPQVTQIFQDDRAKDFKMLLVSGLSSWFCESPEGIWPWTSLPKVFVFGHSSLGTHSFKSNLERSVVDFLMIHRWRTGCFIIQHAAAKVRRTRKSILSAWPWGLHRSCFKSLRHSPSDAWLD